MHRRGKGKRKTGGARRKREKESADNSPSPGKDESGLKKKCFLQEKVGGD